MQKQCTQCNVVKPLEDFAKAKRRADGRSSECKECRKIWARQYFAANDKRKQSKIARKMRNGLPANPYRQALDQAIANKLPTFEGAPCIKCGCTTRSTGGCSCLACKAKKQHIYNANWRARKKAKAATTQAG